MLEEVDLKADSLLGDSYQGFDGDFLTSFCRFINGFLQVVTYMDWDNIDTWISLTCFKDLSKFIYGFLKVVTWICQDL